mmetsp:Transcript_36498/g.85303  ORF Transcript_36498/g.85303 Transcript_36498/m.85303 type:complete len:151 (-) Transcript_36498:322-774(-)
MDVHDRRKRQTKIQGICRKRPRRTVVGRLVRYVISSWRRHPFRIPSIYRYRTNDRTYSHTAGAPESRRSKQPGKTCYIYSWCREQLRENDGCHRREVQTKKGNLMMAGKIRREAAERYRNRNCGKRIPISIVTQLIQQIRISEKVRNPEK